MKGQIQNFRKGSISCRAIQPIIRMNKNPKKEFEKFRLKICKFRAIQLTAVDNSVLILERDKKGVSLPVSAYVYLGSDINKK